MNECAMAPRQQATGKMATSCTTNPCHVSEWQTTTQYYHNHLFRGFLVNYNRTRQFKILNIELFRPKSTAVVREIN